MKLDTKQPPYILEDTCVSWSGKYKGFFGTHYHKGKPCWVVGAVSTTSNEIIARHYNEDTNVNAVAAKFGATQYWETLKEGLLRPPQTEEGMEASLQLKEWFRRFDERAGELGRKQSIDKKSRGSKYVN